MDCVLRGQNSSLPFDFRSGEHTIPHDVWVISRKRLREFWQEHPDAERALRQWHKVAIHPSWTSLVDVRLQFPHADAVPVKSGSPLTVFNIGGNKYRLIARIEYRRHKVYVKGVLTHAEYSRGEWKKIL